MTRRAVLCLTLLVLPFAMQLAVYGKSPRHAPTEADQEWADKNLETALDDLLPMDRPDPAFPANDYIVYRYENWIYVPSREYSFCLMPRPTDASSGPAYSWIARVSIAEGQSISVQLAELHSRNPHKSLAEIERKVRLRKWLFDDRSCPALADQAAKFQRTSFKVPFAPDVLFDAPLFEFQVTTPSTHMRLSLEDRDHPLVASAIATRAALAKCGARETAGP